LWIFKPFFMQYFFSMACDSSDIFRFLIFMAEKRKN